MNLNRLQTVGIALGLSTGIGAAVFGFSQSQAHNQRCQGYEAELLQNRVAFLQAASETQELINLSSSLETAEYLPRIYELQATLERLGAKTGDTMPVYRKVCGEKRFESWKEANRSQLAL
jgi:hypothetical protein